MSARTTRRCICLACGKEQELDIGEPCKFCKPEDDCLEVIEVNPWYDKVPPFKEVS